MLSHQRGDHPQAGQVPTQLEVQRVVVGLINALVRHVERPFHLRAKEVLGIHHLFNAVANPKLGAVHVTRHNKEHSDCKVVVRHICEPERLSLRMETTQEGENSSSRPPLRCQRYG